MKYTEKAVDQHIGQRLRSVRLLRGISQAHLGEKVGLSFQQIQKYERGINRMGGSRIYQMASIMKVCPLYFFEGLDGVRLENHIIMDPETAEMVHLIDNLDDENMKTLKLVLEVFACRLTNPAPDLDPVPCP